MTVSTVVELSGFSALVAASSAWQSVPLEATTGLVTGGLALLFIGYATDDGAASLALRKTMAPARLWWATRPRKARKPEAGP